MEVKTNVEYFRNLPVPLGPWPKGMREVLTASCLKFVSLAPDEEPGLVCCNCAWLAVSWGLIRANKVQSKLLIFLTTQNDYFIIIYHTRN